MNLWISWRRQDRSTGRFCRWVPTGYGDSPYQSCSTFAGNPYFIDLGELIRENLLTEEECSSCDWGDNPFYVDYEKIYNSRFLLLRKAYDRAETESNEEYQEFLKQQNHWIWIMLFSWQ